MPRLRLPAGLRRLLGEHPPPNPTPAQPTGGFRTDEHAGPVWIDRLIRAVEEGGDTAPVGTREPLRIERPRGPWGVGLRDSVLGGWFDSATGQLFPGFSVGAADTVADIGCGGGNLLAFCAEQGAAVIGVDNHPETLAAARRRLAGSAARQQDFHMLPSDGTLPIADGAVTRVICTEVLEHVPDPTAVMAELVRIGAPGAAYLISVPAEQGEELTRLQAPPQYFEAPNHVRVFSRADFTSLVSAAGLDERSYTTTGFFWSVWFALYWHTGVSARGGEHPVLDLWTATWNQLLSSPGGLQAKAALDQTLPKTQVVVAVKPSAGHS